MRNKLLALATATALTVTSGGAFADHNSKNGEGTANMPNDIHNTRVETRETDDNDAFRDFVQYGEGSQTVNRYDSDDTPAKPASEPKGNAQATANQGASAPMNRNEVEAKTATREQSQAETQARNATPPQAGAQTRPQAQSRSENQTSAETRTRSTMSSRSSAGKETASKPSRNTSSARSSSRKGGRQR